MSSIQFTLMRVQIDYHDTCHVSFNTQQFDGQGQICKQVNVVINGHIVYNYTCVHAKSSTVITGCMVKSLLTIFVTNVL